MIQVLLNREVLNMKKVSIIVGSTRENRKGLEVGNWVLSEAKKFNGNLQFEIVDLKEIDLPHYNEPNSPKSNPKYKNETTKKWSKIIKSSDAFIFVTPEYNGYFSGILKDAIDYLYYEWLNKPYGVVGYGSMGAKRAVSQLHNLLISSFNMEDIEVEVGINQVWGAFEEGVLKEENIDGNILDLFKKLDS